MGKGALAEHHPQRLGATVLAAIAERNDLDTADVDDVIFGTSMQVGTQGGDLGRMAALDAGFDITASGVTLDRFCGSGITAANFAAASVMAGLEDVVISGGAEMMSSYKAQHRRPRAARRSWTTATSTSGPCTRRPTRASPPTPSPRIEGIPRTALDELAAESQRRAEVAIKEGRFDRSLVPVLDEDGTVALDREEFPRPGHHRRVPRRRCRRRSQKLADYPLDDGRQHLPPDGAAPLPRPRDRPTCTTPATPRAWSTARRRSSGPAPSTPRPTGWTPRARVVATANVGDDPTLMLNAPVPAARKVLAKAGLTIDDIDLFEVNEAFAVVTEKFIRDLDIDREKINVNGGAIALGHPIGATGAMLIGTVLDELERRDGRYGLVTMCAAGGMAPAIIIERI